ncbi:ornithine cyclodeaminase family protein [Microbaculum marinum]|uniref:Ornithine cyclodeaminase family protein n=1 Tax=Microbaculum marinum TaxID=1764581 RepID=A0AAW9RPD9_9HYPH
MSFDFDALQVVSGAAIDAALPLADGVEVIEAAMREVSAGRADQPLRWLMPLGGGNGMGVMPGAMRSPAVHGMKLISLYPDNPKRGLPSHLGMMLVFDSQTGMPLAVLDASVLTTRRTAAATVVATRALARPEARVHAILGTGELAEAHVRAFAATMPFAETRIWGRRREAAEALAGRIGDTGGTIRPVVRLEDAVAGADVVTTVTAARTPILFGRDLEPGQHVNLVGASMADAREIDDEGVRRGRVYTDLRASAERQAGELIGAMAAGAVGPEHLVGEIGAVLLGELAGRSAGAVGAAEITIYKSHGVAAQDLAYAGAVLGRRIATLR